MDRQKGTGLKATLLSLPPDSGSQSPEPSAAQLSVTMTTLVGRWAVSEMQFMLLSSRP